MGVERNQGINLALGVGFGTFLRVFVVVLGFSVVIAKYATVMFALKSLGGLYLLWLGYKAFRSAAAAKEVGSTTARLKNSSAYFTRE